MVKVQAKVRCNSISTPPWNPVDESTRIVRFAPVYDSNPEHPNFKWSQATPSGYIELTITNPSAFNAFKVTEEYLLTFEAADE